MASLFDAAVIAIGGPDNARPVGAAGGTAAARPLRDIARDVQSAARSGAGRVIFAGGEPTLRRDLGRLLGLPSARGLGSGIVTNGRMLSYGHVRAELRDAAVEYARVALHGASAAVHDPLVCVPGAFAQTVAGIGALLVEAPPSFVVDVACTVTAPGLLALDAWVDLVADLERRAALCLRFVAPLAGLELAQWPDPIAAATAVDGALERARTKGADVTVAWEGFAPCLLPRHAHLRDEILRTGALAFGPAAGRGSLPREVNADRRHPLPCQDCLHGTTCPGAPALLVDAAGEGVLRPTRTVRANAFNFVRDRRLPDFHLQPGDCSASALDLGGTPERSVVLLAGEGATLYHSPSADFTAAEIGAVKNHIEQVYLDVSDTATLTEFTTGIRRVRIADECRTCPERRTCCGAARVADETPFAREERWLEKELSRLRGRVLDVGCGEQPYRDLLGRLIAAGQIEYHGIDPDAEALARVAAAGIGGTLHQNEVEAFTCAAGAFDYVLALRSVNHFRDVQRAFTVITAALREGGQLLLCDSVAFGMLRSAEQVAYADTHAAVGHEHFRNWSSSQLTELLRRYPVRVAAHRPVSVQTSNLWLLKMIRLPDGVSP